MKVEDTTSLECAARSFKLPAENEEERSTLILMRGVGGLKVKSHSEAEGTLEIEESFLWKLVEMPSLDATAPASTENRLKETTQLGLRQPGKSPSVAKPLHAPARKRSRRSRCDLVGDIEQIEDAPG